MKKLLILIITVSTLFIGNMVLGEIGSGGISSGNLWKLIGTAIQPMNSTWTVGSSTLRVAKGWFTALDTTTLTVGGTAAGDLNMGNNNILNANYVKANYFWATSTTATSTFTGGLTAGNNAAFVVNQAASANSLYIAANGNVGIGTTTPRYKLDVWGDLAIGTSTDTNTPALYVDSGNGGRIGIGTTTLAGLLTVGTSTPALVVAPNGYVGLSITEPISLLHGKLTNAVTNDSTDMLTLDHYSSGSPVINFGSGILFRLQDNDGSFNNASRIRTAWGNYNASGYSRIVFSGRNADTNFNDYVSFMPVTSGADFHGGQIGLFDRGGSDSRITWSTSNYNVYFTNTVGGKTIYIDSSTGEIHLNDNANTGNVILVDGGGKVGIDTNSPGYKLTISNGGGALTGGDWAVSSAGSATTTISSATSTFAGGLIVDTSTLYVMADTNNVGIATTTPERELVVNSASATSSISIYSGSATLGGCIEIEGGDGTWAHFITNASAIVSVAGRCE